MQRFASLSRSTLLVVSALAASCLFSAKTHAQLANGDFSSPGLPAGTNAESVITSGTSSTLLTGWTATKSNDADSNIYYYTTNPDAQNGAFFFLNNPPPGFNFAVQLDSSTGPGTTGGGEGFTQGASLSQALSLAPGTYTLKFYISTEIGSNGGIDKGGTSGILVSLNGSGITSGGLTNAEFTTTSPVPATRATAPWTLETTNFTVGTSGSVTLTFTDDPNPALGNFLRSSNVGLGGISIAAIPEPAPLTLIGVGLVSLVGFQNLLKRRRA